LGWFTGITLLAVVAAIPVAWMIGGRDGVDCVVVAAAACGVSGLAALLVQEVFTSPQWVLLHVAVGFLFRMGAPLLLGMAVYLQKGRLAEAGFAFYLLAFYLLTLGLGTVLGLPGKALPQGERR
jgi:hypothetical protein